MATRRGWSLGVALAVLVGSSASGFCVETVPLVDSAAQAESDCARAAWSLEAERARLDASSLPVIESGGVLDPQGAAILALRPRSEVTFAHPPERADAEPGSFAGRFSILVPRAGLWQITLSGAAWVDVVAQGRLVPAVAFTGVHRCPGVRKSLRFQLAAGNATLQLSGAADERLRIALTPLD